MFVGLLLLIAVILVFWSRLSGLERRVVELENRLRTPDVADQRIFDPPMIDEPGEESKSGVPEDAPIPDEPATQAWIRPVPIEPQSENPVRRLVREYFTGGNVVVRIGIIVLFFGVAFLLKYAAEHTRVPIELRLNGELTKTGGDSSE